MAIPDEPLTRGEQYLAKAAGEDVTLPDAPQTRAEQYLAKIAGQDVALPDAPLSRMEQYLDYIAENPPGGGDITLTTLNVSANGTTNAPSGTAYNKVIANVPNSYAAGDEGKVVSNGALVSQTAHAQVTQNGTVDTTTNNSVDVAVPVPTLESKSISANGTYTPASGKAWNEVVVDVPPVGTDLSNTYGALVYEDNGATAHVYGNRAMDSLKYNMVTKAIIDSSVKILESFANNPGNTLTTIEGGSGVEEITQNTFRSASYITSDLSFPKCTKLSGSAGMQFRDCIRLTNVTLGSVGYGMTEIASAQYTFYNCTQSGLTITIFTTGANVDSFLTKIRAGATAATIIIKASEATTYGGTSYAAGATIVNSTV